MPLILPCQAIDEDALLAHTAARAEWDAGFAAEPALRLQWLDAAGAVLTESIENAPDQAHYRETTDGLGGWVYRPVIAPRSLDRDPPEGAAALRISRPFTAAQVFSIDELARTGPPPAADMQIIPAGAAQTRLVVVSERYPAGQRDKFFADAAALHHYWLQHFRPFTVADFADRIAMKALFWPADPVSGNFGTPDPKDLDNRVLEGDENDLARYLHSAGVDVTNRPLVLVLINNDHRRAGAGGSAGRAPGAWRAAWMTTHTADYEDWRAIAMHEVGHAFGLMDEYKSAYDLPERDGEPNVCKVGRDLPHPWSQMLSAAPDPAYARRLPDDGTAVGRFRGARYSSTDYDRPADGCLMRTIGASNAPTPFCRVCAEVIAANL